ncbi:MAG: hypothetical protein ACYCTV_05090 [Leptospirales bacterium]
MLTVAGAIPVFPANQPEAAMGLLHQRPMNPQGACRSLSDPADLVAVLVRQLEKLLRRFHHILRLAYILKYND